MTRGIGSQPAADAEPIQAVEPMRPETTHELLDNVGVEEEQRLSGRRATLASTSVPYAIINNRGELLEGRGERSRQDPGSMTKIWTLYTILAMVEDGELPRSFLQTHRNDLTRMIVLSDNQATLRLAHAAVGNTGRPTAAELEAADGTGRGEAWQPPPPGIFIVPEFARRMNHYAEREGLTGTHFQTVNGQPTQNHYTTPLDMARMMMHVQTDFDDVPTLSQEVDRLFTTRSVGGVASTSAPIWAAGYDGRGKTGSSIGVHGTSGERHYVMAPDSGGYAAVFGAANVGQRVQIVMDLDTRTRGLLGRAPTVAQAPAEAPAPPRSTAAAPVVAASGTLDAAVAGVITPNQRRIVDANREGGTFVQGLDNLFQTDILGDLRRAQSDGLTAQEFNTIFQNHLERKTTAQLNALADRNAQVRERLRDMDGDGDRDGADLRAQLGAATVRELRADNGSISAAEVLGELRAPAVADERQRDHSAEIG